MRVHFLALTALAIAVPAAAKAPVLHIGGWARATVSAQTGTAAYLTIHNAGPGADRLRSVSSPTARAVSIHSTSMAGGVMRMRSVKDIPVPANKSITMRPGGVHLMLTGLREPLKAGEQLPLVLSFEKAGTIRTRVAVRSTPPAVSNHAGH